jgi:cell division protein FtsL
MGGIRTVLQGAGRRWWLAAFVIATLWVWQRYAVVQAGHSIAQHRVTLAELVKTRDALLAENTTLSSRARIESIAVGKLGLSPTPDSQVVRLPRSTFEERPAENQAGTSPAITEKPESIPAPAADAASDSESP